MSSILALSSGAIGRGDERGEAGVPPGGELGDQDFGDGPSLYEASQQVLTEQFRFWNSGTRPRANQCRPPPIVAYLHDTVAIKQILAHMGLSPGEAQAPAGRARGRARARRCGGPGDGGALRTTRPPRPPDFL